MSGPDAPLRLGRDADAEAIIALIDACWSEYPGIILDVDGEEPELRAPASAFAAKGGVFWVAEDAAGALAGMAGVRPVPQDDLPDAWEIARVYVAASQRGGGLAHTLMAKAEAHARAAGARHLVLHSDTRFLRAHRFYARLGYVRHGGIKVLNDRSQSLEFGYAKPVNGAWGLDAAAASSIAPGLGSLISAAAAEGASLRLPGSIAARDAEATAEVLVRAVATGGGALLLGWHGGALAGFAALDLALPPAQAHRATLIELFVRPDARRLGVGRALAGEILASAGRAQRTQVLAVLADTPAGVGFAAALGWRVTGRLADYARWNGAGQAALLAMAQP